MSTLAAPLLWGAAFWVGLLGFRRREPAIAAGLRFAAGLALGAALARAGWALLHLGAVLGEPRILLGAGGFCVLFVPLGVLAVAPRGARGARGRFLGAGFGALPFALATARLGCALAGCCGGVSIESPWAQALAAPPGAALRHPVALYEVGGLLALQLATRCCAAPRRILALVALGLGALRLALEPLRAPSPLGEPAVPPEAIALGWIALGALGLGGQRTKARSSRSSTTACTAGRDAMQPATFSVPTSPTPPNAFGGPMPPSSAPSPSSSTQRSTSTERSRPSARPAATTSARGRS